MLLIEIKQLHEAKEAFGYWVTDDGKILEVDHIAGHFGKLRDLGYDFTDAAERGWIRIVVGDPFLVEFQEIYSTNPQAIKSVIELIKDYDDGREVHIDDSTQYYKTPDAKRAVAVLNRLRRSQSQQYMAA